MRNSKNDLALAEYMLERRHDYTFQQFVDFVNKSGLNWSDVWALKHNMRSYIL